MNKSMVFLAVKIGIGIIIWFLLRTLGAEADREWRKISER